MPLGLTAVLAGLIVAVGLGSIFSLVYPTVAIDQALASLFAVTGVLIVVFFRAALSALRRR